MGVSDAIRVVSLFCGIGGADLGLYLAADELGVEVEVVDAIDSWEPAVRVYNANQRHPVARIADVKQMTRADLPPHDLVIGGPPCQDHSLAGERKCQCHLGGHVTPRCCLADFLRLADGSPYVMENVVSRLIPAPFSVKLCAANFGDVTERSRWFYSNYLLHVIETPGPRRIRDIREAGADERAMKRRLAPNRKTGLGKGNVTCDDGFMQSITSGHGGVSGYLRMTYAGLHKAGCCGKHYSDDGMLGSLTAHSWHGHDVRDGKLMPLNIDRTDGCRNPTILEMQRAHSLPDTWDWCGHTKTDIGKMIANMWPALMAKAVNRAMLSALIAERELAA